MRTAWSLPALIAAFLLAAGCSSSGTSAPPAARGSGGRTMTPPHTTVPVSLPPSPTRTVPAKPTGAQADITTAIHRAKASGRRVLIDFGAGWCVDCRVLDTIMERPAVAPTVKKNFVVVHVNVHNFNFNMDISRMYGNACKGGIPALVVLDGRGKMLVNTHDGSFEHARVFGNSDVLKFLNRWAPKA